MPSGVTAVRAVARKSVALETSAKFDLEVPLAIGPRALASREAVLVYRDRDRDTVAETAKMVHQCVASARLVSVTRSSPDISFGSSVSRREASTMDPVFTQWQEQRSGSRRCHTRTVQKLDRGVDGRSCITLLTDSSSSTSHRAAGGTGRDHGASTGTRHVECLILCGSVTKAPSARQRSLPLKTVSTVFDCVSGPMGGKSAPQTLIGCHQRKALASR